MSRPLYRPGFWDSVQMLFLYQFVFFMIPLVMLNIFLEGRTEDDLLIQIMATLVAFVVLQVWLNRKYQLNLKAYLTRKGWKATYLFPLVLLILGTDILVSEGVNRIQIFLPIDKHLGDTLMSFFSAEVGLGKSFLLVVIIAPICEEVVFRGLILRGFLSHYSMKKAIIVSAFLFGLFHMNIWQFPGAFVWGIIAGWLFAATGSLLICITGHAWMNSIGFIAMILKERFDLTITGFSSDYGQIAIQPLWFTIMGLIMMCVGMVGLWGMVNKNN